MWIKNLIRRKIDLENFITESIFLFVCKNVFSLQIEVRISEQGEADSFENIMYNSIKQLTTVMHCYILFADGGETYAYNNQ